MSRSPNSISLDDIVPGEMCSASNVDISQEFNKWYGYFPIYNEDNLERLNCYIREIPKLLERTPDFQVINTASLFLGMISDSILSLCDHVSISTLGRETRVQLVFKIGTEDVGIIHIKSYLVEFYKTKGIKNASYFSYYTSTKPTSIYYEYPKEDSYRKLAECLTSNY